jgi:hypothetical protein
LVDSALTSLPPPSPSLKYCFSEWPVADDNDDDDDFLFNDAGEGEDEEVASVAVGSEKVAAAPAFLQHRKYAARSDSVESYVTTSSHCVLGSNAIPTILSPASFPHGMCCTKGTLLSPVYRRRRSSVRTRMWRV